MKTTREELIALLNAALGDGWTCAEAVWDRRPDARRLTLRARLADGGKRAVALHFHPELRAALTARFAELFLKDPDAERMVIAMAAPAPARLVWPAASARA